MMPTVTVAFLSWNRLHYLKATLSSARRCIRYPHLEWIVSDNKSTEPGLAEYVAGIEWLDRLLIKKQSHAEAMNEVLDVATGDYILLWPDDIQFVVEGDWMKDCVDVMERYRDMIGSMSLNCLRKRTWLRILHPSPVNALRRCLREIRDGRFPRRRSRRLQSKRGCHFITVGAAWPGVIPSGIPSLTSVEKWRNLGPWRASKHTQSVKDSSMGAEDDMIARFNRSRYAWQVVCPFLPVAADIITDPTGCKAKVRGRFRFGVYMPPPQGDFYYRVRAAEEFSVDTLLSPLDFSALVEPLGFRIPVDQYGDHLKSDINTSIVYDLQCGREVLYPLSLPQNPNLPY